MLEVLAPGFRRAPLESLEEPTVGVAWLELADPLVAARVEEAAARFPRRQAVAFPLPPRIRAVFMREVADVHRELYAENADLYGENVAAKVEACLRITDAQYETDLASLHGYGEQALEAIEGFDLLLTPTVPMVAPPADAAEIEIREAVTRFTYPINGLGWPALALPCGPAEDGLAASVQLVGRPGSDASVLAAGALLEAALASPI